MPRILRTLMLSTTALAALATAAVAAPAAMHTADGDMAAMHASMMADPGRHASMLDLPVMQDHMAEHGIDVDEMRRWHDEGRSLEQMHRDLAGRDVDVEAMQADCPMLAGGMMSTMPRGDGGHAGHHGMGGSR